MIGTESKLWQSMSRYREQFKSLTRIESPIVCGIPDVEYVSPFAHGWIELKTASPPLKGKKYFLHSYFTLAQSSWLLSHHQPTNNLRSYLLLGVLGPRTWRRFVLLEPNAALLLVKGWVGIPHEELESRPGVIVTRSIEEVMARISSKRRYFTE
jgi:hypothetical protein